MLSKIILKMSSFLRRVGWWFNEVQLPKMSVNFIKILSASTSATSHWINDVSNWKHSLRHKMIHVFQQRFIQLFNKNKVTNIVLQIRISSPQLFLFVEILQHQASN